MGSLPHAPAWKWLVCGQLLLATMINYMDRQTLSQLAPDIRIEFRQRGLELKDIDYGYLEQGFGLAFAAGSLMSGFLVDRIGVRSMYPVVLLCWSAAGFATSWANNFTDLLLCRMILGFFEAGQWPCALATSQRILARQDRTLGNGLLQSGAALGAILTPLVIQLMIPEDSHDWRGPFQVIGVLGIIWVIAWFSLIRRGDLTIPESQGPEVFGSADAGELTAPALPRTTFLRRFLVLAVVAVVINLCWHFFRAWLPKFLREYHGYDRATVNYFMMGYYLAADLGCVGAGLATRWLVVRGWGVHAARVWLYFLCALLTAFSMVAAALPAGGLLLGILLVIAFGALGLFPNYYALSQELTTRHQGKVSGTLGCINWTASAFMHPLVGKTIDATQSYATGLFVAGLLPLIGLVVLLALWNRKQSSSGYFSVRAE